jgi:hypothetical protein
MERLRQQIRALDIPFPQRYLLELEVTRDLECSGLNEVDSAELHLPPEVVLELEDAHSTGIHRHLKRLGSLRRIVETGLAFIPLVLTLSIIMEEEAMVNFVREGGIGMYAIMAVGVFLVGRELLNIGRLMIVKDHSLRNLRLDTPTVLLGCLALLMLGIGSTVMGFYLSAESATRSGFSHEILVVGAKESLTHMVLSLFLCAAVLLAHYGSRRVLHIWRVPV